MPLANIKPIPGDRRLTFFPISRPGLFQYYKDAQRSFWTPEEIDFSKDREHYDTRLTPGQRRFVDHVLAFFAASDKIVNMNLAKRFKEDVPIIEAEAFYDIQMAIENVHAETYALQLDTIVTDTKRKNELLDSLNKIPSIKAMTDWMFACMSSDESFAKRLLRMACVEGIFFSGCFCAIYWLQNKGGLMPGLGHANELIARDEGLHTMFALFLYTMLDADAKPSQAEVHDIFDAAVQIAKTFIISALPEPLPEMNAALMSSYIEYVADNLLSLIDIKPLYGTKNPFPFMEQLNLENRTNFFERRVSEYSKPQSSDADNWDDPVQF